MNIFAAIVLAVFGLRVIHSVNIFQTSKPYDSRELTSTVHFS